MHLQPVVGKDPHDRGRDAGHNGLAPQADRITINKAFSCPVVLFDGPDRIPVEDYDRQDRSQLDHNEKHLPENSRDAQRHKLIQQDHMAGAADRKPFRDAFHQAEQRGF